MENLFNKIEFRTWDEYNLSEDAKLDKFQLDVEAQRQGEYMLKWLSLLQQAQTILTHKQEVLENVKAQLILEVKRNGIEGIPKVTEAAADAWVQTNSRYVEALTAKNKANSDVLYLQNARLVLEHKRDMIKVLDHLWVAGFYARPNVSEKTTENAYLEATKEELAKAFKRRRHID